MRMSPVRMPQPMPKMILPLRFTGLGQRVHEEAFYSQFVNDEPDVRFYAKTEGKDTDVTWTKIDAVSAATISSNAVCTAVNQARAFYAAVLAMEQK